MTKRIAFTVYPVKNLAASKKFYEEHLGLKCTEPAWN
jgi:catechol 2,3-dioxygenase-like lactoylglutathione lyase family enzyme